MLSTKYYIVDNNADARLVEVTKSEYILCFGTEEIRSYVEKVYCGIITINEVPIELRESVQTVVNNKTKRYGEYDNQEISEIDLQQMIEEML